MEKSITVSYLLNDKATSISVLLMYNIERADNIQTVTCTINKSNEMIPLWLHPHKFEIKSMYHNGKYETLFNFENNTKNLEATLFIDEAYAAIMTKEHLKVV
jgi:hypothetical protein